MINEEGQIAVDFLLGISLFLIALMFVVQFIPGLFMSGSAGESSLDYTAYRTATILTEDPGWWGNSTSSSTDWESHTNNIMRIGLAVDDDNSSKSTNRPNIISRDKIIAMMQVNESIFVDRLGLYDNVNDAVFSYGYNISILKDEQYLSINNTAITRGDPAPPDRETSRITRLMLVETGRVAYINATELTTNLTLPSNTSLINVKGPLSENITIQLGQFDINGTNPSLKYVKLNGSTLTTSADYTVYEKNGATRSSPGSTLDTDDVLCLDFNSSLFEYNRTYSLELTFSDITFTRSAPPYFEFTENCEPLYEPAYLNVEVWQ